MSSVLGTILDPAADKALMTTLTITLTIQELIPGQRLSSATVVFAQPHTSMSYSSSCSDNLRPRRATESFSILHPIFNTTLPSTLCQGCFNLSKNSSFGQKTFSRYWDFSLPSAEVRPTGISKVGISSFVSHSSSHPAQVNTALQLLLMGMTTVTPILPIDIGLQLHGLQ